MAGGRLSQSRHLCSSFSTMKLFMPRMIMMCQSTNEQSSLNWYEPEPKCSFGPGDFPECHDSGISPGATVISGWTLSQSEPACKPMPLLSNLKRHCQCRARPPESAGHTGMPLKFKFHRWAVFGESRQWPGWQLDR